MTTLSKHVQAAALALACAVACWGAGALELRLGPELVTHPWRLWTAHLVHASPTHFLLDVGAGVVLIALGAPLASYLWLAPVVALGVAATRPDLATYVGLSGVLHGWFVLAVLRSVRPGIARTALLFAVLIKVVTEIQAATTSLGGLDFGAVPVAEAHLIGALAAAAFANFRTRPAKPSRV
ncbi:MAG: rhombosortase, partial [Planctomycetota bacterium]